MVTPFSKKLLKHSVLPDYFCRAPLENILSIPHLSSELLGEDLAPAARGGAQVHHLAHPLEDVELIVNLHQFKGAPGPPSFLLSQS